MTIIKQAENLCFLPSIRRDQLTAIACVLDKCMNGHDINHSFGVAIQVLSVNTVVNTGLTQLAQCDRIYIVHRYYIKVAYPKEIDEISNSNRLC